MRTWLQPGTLAHPPRDPVTSLSPGPTPHLRVFVELLSLCGPRLPPRLSPHGHCGHTVGMPRAGRVGRDGQGEGSVNPATLTVRVPCGLELALLGTKLPVLVTVKELDTWASGS